MIPENFGNLCRLRWSRVGRTDAGAGSSALERERDEVSASCNVVTGRLIVEKDGLWKQNALRAFKTAFEAERFEALERSESGKESGKDMKKQRSLEPWGSGALDRRWNRGWWAWRRPVNSASLEET